MSTRFSTPVQTGPGAHPASCTMGTGSFLGVKRPGRGADHPPPSKCRGHERVGLYLHSPSGPQWPVIGRTKPNPNPLCTLRIFSSVLLYTFISISPRRMSVLPRSLSFNITIQPSNCRLRHPGHFYIKAMIKIKNDILIHVPFIFIIL